VHCCNKNEGANSYKFVTLNSENIYIVGLPEGPEKYSWHGGGNTKLRYHCIASNTVSKEQKNFYNLYKQLNHGHSSIFHILTRLVRDKSNTTQPHVNLQLVMNPNANNSVCCYSYDIYKAYTKCLQKCQERVLHTKTRKEVHFNIYPQTVFHAQPNSELNSVLQIFICANT
jgi:hypothetical protein